MRSIVVTCLFAFVCALPLSLRAAAVSPPSQETPVVPEGNGVWIDVQGEQAQALGLAIIANEGDAPLKEDFEIEDKQDTLGQVRYYLKSNPLATYLTLKMAMSYENQRVAVLNLSVDKLKAPFLHVELKGVEGQSTVDNRCTLCVLVKKHLLLHVSISQYPEIESLVKQGKPAIIVTKLERV